VYLFVDFFENIIMIKMQYSGTALLLLVNPHTRSSIACPTYAFIIRKEDASLPAMFNPLYSSMNQQLLIVIDLFCGSPP